MVLNAAGNGCVAANAFQLIRVAPVVANATQPIVNKVEIALPATVTEVAYVTNTPQMITVTDVSTVYVGSTNCAEITIVSVSIFNSYLL